MRVVRQISVFSLIAFWCSLIFCSPAAAQGTPSQAAAPPGVSEVYLVQTSGWMEPFYADQGSQFRQLVNSLIGATRLPDSQTVVATFNQNGQIPGHGSPELVFNGPYDPSKTTAIVNAIQPLRRADGKYADSDFFGALTGTISGILRGRQGIIWMITNNKVSPNNSQEVIENTQKFYDDLRKSEFIHRIVAFPVRMPVHGPHYDERGFIIYGIAYGEAAASTLNSIIAEGQPIREIFTSPPVRLKPLDQDPLQLHLKGQSSGAAKATLEGGFLTIRHIPANTDSDIVLTGDLVNTYYPQQVRSADLSATSTSSRGVPSFGAQILPSSVKDLAPGSLVHDVRIDLHFPAVRRASVFQDHAETSGYLVIRLSNASLSLGADFVERMKNIFGANLLVRDQGSMVASGLPAVFFDYRRVNAASTVIPVVLIYDFSPWPLIAAASAGLLLLALLGYGGYRLTMPRRYTVRVGGSAVPVSLRPFEKRIVLGGGGVRAWVRGPVFGSPSVETIEPS